MTVLWEFRKIFRLGVPKKRKIKKVTTSQDDGFVGGLEIQLIGYPENTKGSKKSQSLGMTKDRATFLWGVVPGPNALFITLGPATTCYSTTTLSFVIPSEAEGSAVPRTFPGITEPLLLRAKRIRLSPPPLLRKLLQH